MLPLFIIIIIIINVFIVVAAANWKMMTIVSGNHKWIRQNVNIDPDKDRSRPSAFLSKSATFISLCTWVARLFLLLAHTGHGWLNLYPMPVVSVGSGCFVAFISPTIGPLIMVLNRDTCAGVHPFSRSVYASALCDRVPLLYTAFAARYISFCVLDNFPTKEAREIMSELLIDVSSADNSTQFPGVCRILDWIVCYCRCWRSIQSVWSGPWEVKACSRWTCVGRFCNLAFCPQSAGYCGRFIELALKRAMKHFGVSAFSDWYHFH